MLFEVMSGQQQQREEEELGLSWLRISLAGQEKEPHDAFIAASLGDLEQLNDIYQRSGLAELKRKNAGGWTVLMYGAYAGHLNVVKFLVHLGVDLEEKANDGRTSLALAAGCGHCKAVQLLLQRGCKVDVRDHRDWTPLFHAVLAGQDEVLAILLGHGANPNVIEHDWWLTPLMLSAQQGRELISRTLLQCGADPTLVSRSGETARTLAQKNGFRNIVALIDEYKSKKQVTQTASPHHPRNLPELLAQLGLSKYLPCFEAEEVDLQVFLTMNEDELKSIGIERLGPRKKLVLAIQQWRSCKKDAQDSMREGWKNAQSILGQIQTLLDQQKGCASGELQGLVTQLQDLAGNMCRL